MFKLVQLGLISIVGATLIGCAASPVSESAGEYLDSAAVTTKVKASLINELGTSGLKINVKTYKDEVQLSGFVDSVTIRQRAGEIAAGVPDIGRVRNNLIVK